MQPVRGTHDLLPDEFRKHDHILDIARAQTQAAGFEEMATPLMEFRSVFDRTLGETSDIVSKEMYEIHDRVGEGNIVLRPESSPEVFLPSSHGPVRAPAKRQAPPVPSNGC